jgi:hypothetical protein
VVLLFCPNDLMISAVNLIIAVINAMQTVRNCKLIISTNTSHSPYPTTGGAA